MNETAFKIAFGVAMGIVLAGIIELILSLIIGGTFLKWSFGAIDKEVNKMFGVGSYKQINKPQIMPATIQNQPYYIQPPQDKYILRHGQPANISRPRGYIEKDGVRTYY